jgi:N-acetylneuraminic acid mutarotase
MTLSATSLIGVALMFAAHGLAHAASPAVRAREANELQWAVLPSLPDREGLAAPFAGVSGSALLVAGGANFPEKKPWEGGTKVWHDRVFVLEEIGGAWKVGGNLPRPLGYGVSVSTANGVLCMGGSDADRHYADVFLLQWTNGQLHRREMPQLPKPCANMSGALVGNVVYLAGGIDSPTATNALKAFWSLDLAAKQPRWQTLEPWPGRARMLAVAGAHEDAFYLFSGVDLHAGVDGKPVRTYLRDAYRYMPGQGWRRLSDLPRAAVAAPSPAAVRDGQLLVISGDDGTLVNFEPKSRHPGFPRDVLAYDPRNDKWSNIGTSLLSRATVPVVEWRGFAVIPNGEMRPGVRSPEVWMFK